MDSRLTLEYEFSRDGDDFGWLIASVETPDFRGRNGFWVQWQDLVEFGESLAMFPIPADRPIAKEWGFAEQGEAEIVTRLSISPEGRTGALIAEIYLANFYDPFFRCQTRFRTDYPALDRFRVEIAVMMRREAQSAVLAGSDITPR